MIQRACLAGVSVLVGLCAACVRLQPSRPLPPMPATELPPGVNTVAQARSAYTARLSKHLPDLSGVDLDARRQAEQAFQASCWLATRPGAEVERQGVCAAMAQALAGDLPKPTRLFLLNQLRIAGREEAVPALAADLAHDDAEIRDAGRRALAANPATQAGRALQSRLAQTQDEAEKAALLLALLERHDKRLAPVFRQAVRDGAEAVCVIAIEGLASRGNARDAALLRNLMETGPAALRPVATDAYLRLADALAKDGSATTARKMYRGLLQAPAPTRYAAIVGLGQAGGQRDIPVLLGILGEDDPEARGAARSALALLPAGQVLPAINAELDTAAPPLRKSLLQTLAESRVPAVRPALTRALSAADEELRLIALNGLGWLGDPLAAPALAEVVATAQGHTLEGARDALALIPGDAVVTALINACAGATPAGRSALLQTLSTRRSDHALVFLRQTAAADPAANVRVEAMRGLARLAGGGDIPDLLRLLLGAVTEAEREEATKAIAAAARRSAEPETCVAPVLNAWSTASPEARALLLRALGRLGGDQALATVRSALGDPAAGIRAAAVRALTDWPDQAALGDLLALVRTAPELVHRVLALRGYVRIVHAAADMTPADKLACLTSAMAAAPRPEDRRLVLAGLAEVSEPGALAAAVACLDQPETASEAAAAVTMIVDLLRWRYPHECHAALGAVAQQAPAEAERRKATDLQADIRRYEDHIATWLVAGPYSAEGKARADLHALVFPPEQTPPTEPVDWKAAKTGPAPEKSWYVPLEDIVTGSNRVAYLRTWIRSGAGQKARLEIGTDDGCKVWLNQALVVDQNVDRALAPAQDVPEITLSAGWNCLLLKVTQGGGNWSAGARFRALDGGPARDVVSLDSLQALPLLAADLDADPANPNALATAADMLRANLGNAVDLRPLLVSLACVKDAEIAKDARDRLQQLDAGEDYLVYWEMAGPYEKAGVEGTGLLDVVFPPEQTEDKQVRWAPAPVTAGTDRIPVVDLAKLIGGDHRAAYLRARIVSPAARMVRFELGSDDGVKLWLNGQLVHSNNTFRPLRPGDDKLNAELRPGPNDILMKVTQGAGGWSACLRCRTPEGKHLDGVSEPAP